MTREELNKLRDDIFCDFCNKKCKSYNSLIQHRLRCPKNPDRRSYDNLKDFYGITKGHTYNDDETVKKSTDTLRQKYKNGFIYPLKGKVSEPIQYIYRQHNNEEINKWLNYIKDINIPPIKINKGKEYIFISQKQMIDENIKQLIFEHNYIANILLDGNLSKNNTVHHIDKNGLNNDKFNLMIFASNNEHKRFHNSKYAFITYNPKSHLFNCIIKKDKN